MSSGYRVGLLTRRAFTIASCWLSLFCGTALAHTVTLTWTLSTDPTPLHQNVWRQKSCTGSFVKYAQVPATVATYTVSIVTNGMTYCYYVTVEDKPTQEVSSPSNIVTVVIPAT